MDALRTLSLAFVCGLFSTPALAVSGPDNSSHKCLRRTIGQHLSIALFLLVLMGVGLSATAHAQIRAYVASVPDTVSVIDTATNTVVATIPVGAIPFAPFGIAITPDGTRVYVPNLRNPPNTASGSVAVIDTATNSVVTTIPVGMIPEAVAITPDGTRAYVAVAGSNTVAVIDTATNSVVATIAGVNVLIGPVGVAITPDGTRAYVVNGASASVAVIDTATNTVVATIDVGVEPVGVAITPDGTRAYVVNMASNSVSVIDTASNSVVATIRPIPGGGEAGWGVAITPDGTRAYVGNLFSPMSVIDTATNSVVATIPILGAPVAVAITPDGTRAYVTGFGSRTSFVSVIDTASNSVVATIPVGGGPVAVAITPAQRAPKSKQECMHGGYLKFGPPAGPFKNQGQCVSYVEHH